MKISLNWLKKYVDIKISDAELVQLIGSRLVEVEGVIDETHKYDKIFIVKVASAEKIPDTHLTLCQVDTGGEELTQVVCGAPNVRAGMLAVWIAPGAVVPASVHEDAPFVIGKRRMLGKYDSNGMLAAADELDIGDDHAGIIEINPNDAKPGDLFADVFELKDLILDIENKSLTHRPDCFGLIGFAREVAGILGINFNYDSREMPKKEWFLGHRQKTAELQVTIQDKGICDRYTAIILEKHGEIRKKYLTWQDTILAKSGMRPVDPIVDATNYLMLLTGQPLHAFDYDKLIKVGGTEKPKIIVRLAREGEKLVLIGNKEIELNENDIVITSNDVPIGLAGAMGGMSTEIDKDTRKVVLESATFSLYNLRKTQMEHGIFSEAITRFTKGQPAYQTMDVAESCVSMLAEGFRAVEVVDEYPKVERDVEIEIEVSSINELLGTRYSTEVISRTLMNVGFEVKVRREKLIIKVPKWRTDIFIKEDIIEEVGRLLGYDNIFPTLPEHGTAKRNKMFELKAMIRDTLAQFGANETLTYSFVNGRILEKAGLPVENSYKIVNSISPDLQYIRQSIVPSLLDKAYMNQKIPFDKFALFEMNKVYRKEWGGDVEKVPIEKINLGFIVAERKGVGTAYYKAKKFVEELLRSLNFEPEFLPIKTSGVEVAPFENKRAAEIWAKGVRFGIVGEFKNSVRHNFKLAEFLAGFELDLDVILANLNLKREVKAFGTSDKQDLTIATTKNYAEVLAEVQEKYPGAKITPLSIYQPKESEIKNISFHLEFGAV